MAPSSGATLSPRFQEGIYPPDWLLTGNKTEGVHKSKYELNMFFLFVISSVIVGVIFVPSIQSASACHG